MFNSLCWKVAQSPNKFYRYRSSSLYSLDILNIQNRGNLLGRTNFLEPLHNTRNSNQRRPLYAFTSWMCQRSIFKRSGISPDGYLMSSVWVLRESLLHPLRVFPNHFEHCYWDIVSSVQQTMKLHRLTNRFENMTIASILFSIDKGMKE